MARAHADAVRARSQASLQSRAARLYATATALAPALRSSATDSCCPQAGARGFAALSGPVRSAAGAGCPRDGLRTGVKGSLTCGCRGSRTRSCWSVADRRTYRSQGSARGVRIARRARGETSSAAFVQYAGVPKLRVVVDGE